MSDFEKNYDDEMRDFVGNLIGFNTTEGNEEPAQDWLLSRLDGLGFETYEWVADPEMMSKHPSFPDSPSEIQVENRKNIGGVMEFGDPDKGPILLLNGHMDVVPVEEELWSNDPFEPTWNGNKLTARGAVDMKSALTSCVFAPLYLKDLVDNSGDVNGRVIVESVVGEEEGGIGAASAVLSNPYPFGNNKNQDGNLVFEHPADGAIVAEPTELRPVTATEGCLMKKVRVKGRSAHAATKWRGESVIPHFIHVYEAFEDLEKERAERVSHPLYEGFDNPWPVNFGTVQAGRWASTVPAVLETEIRIGVAPGETVDSVEVEFEDELDKVVSRSEWMSEHPPDFERFSIQFEPSETNPKEPVVKAVQRAMKSNGLTDTDPTGVTYGADSRHYNRAGVPTVVFGPGSINQAHFPDETIDWTEVLIATQVMADAAHTFLGN